MISSSSSGGRVASEGWLEEIDAVIVLADILNEGGKYVVCL